MNIKNRKGIALNQAFGAVLTLVLVAVLVIVGIFLLSNLGTTFTGYSGSIINETGGYLNSSNAGGYTLGNSTTCNFASPVITTVTNATDAVIIAPGNYTLVGNVLKNATAAVWTNVKVSYTYTWGGQACLATASTITNFSGYPALIGLVGTIIFLGLVIGVLVASFVFGGRRGA